MNCNKNLGGARFELYSENGRPLRCATSNANGIVKFDELPLGTYIVKELKAPEGYAVNPTPYRTTLSECRPIIELDVPNKELKGMVIAHVIPERCKLEGCGCGFSGDNGCNTEFGGKRD